MSVTTVDPSAEFETPVNAVAVVPLIPKSMPPWNPKYQKRWFARTCSSVQTWSGGEITGIEAQFAGRGVTLQSGGVPPASYAALPIALTPAGIGELTVVVTVSTRLPPSGTFRPLHSTLPPTMLPPLSAESNVTFGSSTSVTA